MCSWGSVGWGRGALDPLLAQFGIAFRTRRRTYARVPLDPSVGRGRVRRATRRSAIVRVPVSPLFSALWRT